MAPIKIDKLKVPGAELYYEIRGSGPVLLLACGGVYDAAGYSELAQRLADRYTVVTYDRRGNSRSPLEGPPQRQRIAVHADDAHRLLTAVGVTGDERAAVFGNSSGAIIGLELAIQHPEQVRVVVAHEPPLFEVLPDREYFRTMLRDVAEAFAVGGVPAAGQILGERLQMRQAPQEEQEARIPGGAEEPAGSPDPETLAMLARFERNTEFFMGYEVPGFGEYSPNLDQLRASGVRVVMAAGKESEGEPPYRAAFALADLLGTETVIVPGDHGGFGIAPDEFAAALRAALTD